MSFLYQKNMTNIIYYDTFWIEEAMHRKMGKRELNKSLVLFQFARYSGKQLDENNPDAE